MTLSAAEHLFNVLVDVSLSSLFLMQTEGRHNGDITLVCVCSHPKEVYFFSFANFSILNDLLFKLNRNKIMTVQNLGFCL